MTPFAPPEFWERFYALPENIQARAREDFALWCEDPYNPRLRFKRIRTAGPDKWSVRIGLRYRAVGSMRENENGEREIAWYWIGTREAYEHIV